MQKVIVLNETPNLSSDEQSIKVMLDRHMVAVESKRLQRLYVTYGADAITYYRNWINVLCDLAMAEDANS